jgi:hypothetical protein
MANSPFYKLLFFISLRFYIQKVATKCIQRIYSPVFLVRNVSGSAVPHWITDPILLLSPVVFKMPTKDKFCSLVFFAFNYRRYIYNSLQR